MSQENRFIFLLPACKNTTRNLLAFFPEGSNEEIIQLEPRLAGTDGGGASVLWLSQEIVPLEGRERFPER